MVESDSAPNSQKGDQVLRSFQEWMVQQAHAAKTTNQAADVDNHASGKGCHSSPSIAPRESSIEASSSASPEPIDPSQQANIHAAKTTTQAADIDNHASGKGSYFSPSIAPREPSIEASSSASPELIDPSQQANIPPVASNRPFVGKRMVRTVVGGVLIAIVVAVAWQTYRDNHARKLVKAWGHSSVIWLSSALGATERVLGSTAESSTKLSDQTSTPAVTPRLRLLCTRSWLSEQLWLLGYNAEEMGTASSSNSGVALIFCSHLPCFSHSQMPSLHPQCRTRDAAGDR